MVEPSAVNRVVAGSSPALPAMFWVVWVLNGQAQSWALSDKANNQTIWIMRT